MTAQFPENLIYKDEHLAMCDEPLVMYLEQKCKADYFKPTITACKRGYIGTWRIVNDKLYLIELEGTLQDGSQASLLDLFSQNPDGVWAEWFSGEVRCPKGKLLNYVHGDYDSVYEHDLFLEFKKGVLVHERLIENGIGDEDAEEEYQVAGYLSLN